MFFAKQGLTIYSRCSIIYKSRRISGYDSIWYATNIEIYNYVKAYDSLVFSADGTMVYNPTLYKIWFRTDSQLYSVNSGETLCLNEK